MSDPLIAFVGIVIVIAGLIDQWVKNWQENKRRRQEKR